MTEFPPFNCMDYRQPSNPSIWITPTPRSQRYSVSSVPSPFSRICRCVLTYLRDRNHVWAAPPTSPKFTESLRLHGKNRLITRRLLELPDGLHFSMIQLRFHGGDADSRTMTDLVSKCSGTLKCLCLCYHPMSTSPLVSTVD